MPDLATLLDDEYVPVGGAANSLARWLPGSTVSFDDRWHTPAEATLDTVAVSAAENSVKSVFPAASYVRFTRQADEYALAVFTRRRPAR
jgi:hypothetical protein